MIARGRIAVVVLALTALVLGGCSAAEEGSGGGEVQVNLPDGRSVTVPETPQRVITMGGQWTDVALAFGVTPVGYYDWAKASTGEMQPWYGDRLDDSTYIDPNAGDLVGTIASLEPDLILAPGFSTEAPEYDKIVKLAPTIDRISGSDIDPWEDMVTLMGTLLHQPDKATEIIADTQGEIDSLADEFPTLEGKTYTFAFMYGNDQLSVFGDETDGAALVFSQLGLQIAPRLAEESDKTGYPRFGVSSENLSWLDSDLLVVATTGKELENRLKDLPGYGEMASVRSDAVAFLSQSEITGLNEPSPGSLPYALKLIKPALAEAAKR